MDKELEEAIKLLEELATWDTIKVENGDKAIQTVLNALEQKDKEIQELKEDRYDIYKANEKLADENEILVKETNEYIKGNFISKSKIRENIEELYIQDEMLSDDLSDPTCNFNTIDKNLKIIKIKIDTLKELLE